MPQKLFLFFSIPLLFLTMVACNNAPSATQNAAIEDAPTTPAEVKDMVSWYQYDQNNEDPASDERVGNEYLRKTIPQFNKEFEGKWNWINQPKAFDKIIPEVVAAVQSGAEVPDIFIIFNNQSIVTFHRHGTLWTPTRWKPAKGRTAACIAFPLRNVRSLFTYGKITFPMATLKLPPNS